MKKISTLFAAIAVTTLSMAQPPSDLSSKYPQGATYTLSDGSTVTKSGETLSSSTQYYNVVQVSKGTLTLTNCALENHREQLVIHRSRGCQLLQQRHRDRR